MRVLVATNMYPRADNPARGAFVKAQVDALLELGVSLEVFQVRGDRRKTDYVLAPGSLRRIVRAFAPDIVYAFYGLTGWVALWQPRPVVLSLAGDDILGTPDGRGGLSVRSRIDIALSQWASWRAAAVCVQSEEMRTRLWGTRLRERALVIPYGVDPRRFRPGKAAAARAALGLPLDELIVLFPSIAEVPRKRFDLAQAAMEIVQRDLPKAGLRVPIKAPHDTMPSYYQAADCMVLTSDWEGSPNVVKEALLCGLPVVSTDVGDVRRWLLDSPDSVICQQTPVAIAAALRRVLNARRRVDPAPFAAAFSSRATAAMMMEVFQGVLRARGERCVLQVAARALPKSRA